MKSPSLLGWYRILRVHYQWTCSKRFGLHSDSAAKRHETPTLPAIAPNFARLDQRGPNKLLLQMNNRQIFPTTSFSSCPRHCCRMKRFSTTRNLCVCQHPQSLCASSFSKPRLSAFSSLVFVSVLRFRCLFLSRCRLPCSTAQLRRTSAPHLPSIEFA